MSRGGRVVPPDPDREVEEELSFHLEMRIRDLMAAGMSAEEARREALRRQGDVERVRSDMRREAGRREAMEQRTRWMDEAAQDIRYAFRQLRRAPSFTVVAVLALGLAQGAATAVFSVVDAVLLRPLPFERPEELAGIWTRYLPESGFDIPRFSLSGPEALDLQEGLTSFSRTGIYQGGGSRTLTGQGADAERVRVGFVGDEIFPILGIPPHLGRWFTSDEDAADGPAVVVLGHELWQTRYGADSTLIGRTILLNGEPAEVVGVMPAGFAFPSASAAWLPLGLDRTNQGNRGGHSLSMIGRLAPGRTLDDAHAELAVFREQWAAEYPHNVGHYAWAQDLKEWTVGTDAPRTLLLLLSAAGLVLLVACANVANLLLARGERRLGEVGIRTALGAGRARLARQLATESVVLGVLGGGLGVLLAWLGTPALVAVAPQALPRLTTVTLNGPVLAFAFVLTAATTLLFGVAPGVLSARRASAAAASGGRASVSRRSALLRRTLVTGEVALGLVVVLLAGLLVRSWSALNAEERGLDTSGLLTFSVTLPAGSYPNDAVDPAFAALRDAFLGVGGARAVSASTALPFSGSWSQWDFQLDDRPPRQEGDRAWNAGVVWALGEYFETLGIPLLEGRGITSSDGPDAPLVGVVSETMARTYWPGESAVGKRWGYPRDGEETPWITVVGVAPDPVMQSLTEEPYPFVWIPWAQVPRATGSRPRTLTFALRTSGDPAAAAPAARAALAAFDGSLALYGVRTMDEAVATSLARPRLATHLVSLFGGLALLLAGVGVYAVVSYAVAGRTREIGVRMALGAERSGVVRMIVLDGARPVLVGVVLGLGAAWFATRLVEAMLFGVAAQDPATFVLAPAVLVGVGVAASAIPALRAARIHPTEALRE